VFLCRACKVTGDLIALVQLVDGCTFREAVEALTGEQAARRRIAAPAPAIDQAEYERAQACKAALMWQRRRPIAGTPADRWHAGRATSARPRLSRHTAGDARLPAGNPARSASGNDRGLRRAGRTGARRARRARERRRGTSHAFATGRARQGRRREGKADDRAPARASDRARAAQRFVGAGDRRGTYCAAFDCVSGRPLCDYGVCRK